MGKMALLALLTLSTVAYAEEDKGIRFLNLTASEITSLQLSPAGKKAWGANQCEHDRDGVAHNKRIKIAGVEPGVYDAKFRDKLHRECIIKNVNVKANGVFSIEEKMLGGFCTMY